MAEASVRISCLPAVEDCLQAQKLVLEHLSLPVGAAQHQHWPMLRWVLEALGLQLQDDSHNPLPSQAYAKQERV